MCVIETTTLIFNVYLRIQILFFLHIVVISFIIVKKVNNNKRLTNWRWEESRWSTSLTDTSCRRLLFLLLLHVKKLIKIKKLLAKTVVGKKEKKDTGTREKRKKRKRWTCKYNNVETRHFLILPHCSACAVFCKTLVRS